MKIEGTDIGLKIMPLYLEGKTITEIAKEFCIDSQKLTGAINEFIKDNKIVIQKQRVKAINAEDIFNLKKLGKSNSYISMIYNISRGSIEKIIKNYCEENNIDKAELERKKVDDSIPNEEIINDFKGGYTLNQLSAKYKMTISNIKIRITEQLSQEEIQAIFNKNRTKDYVGDEKVHEMMELYQEGIARNTIASKLGCSIKTVKTLLSREFRKIGKSDIPKIITKSVFLSIIKKKKYTRDEMIEEAEQLNIIIPKSLLDEYFGKEAIDLKRIRKFVIMKFNDVNLEENDRKKIFKNFNVAKFLSENNFDKKYQVLALIYSLLQFPNTTMEEIESVLDNDAELIKAFKLINNEDELQDKYIEELLKNEMAKNVKLAIILEELKEQNINKVKIDLNNYSKYINLAKGTKFKVEYDIAIMENNQLFKGNDR